MRRLSAPGATRALLAALSIVTVVAVTAVLLVARAWSSGDGGSYAPVATVTSTRLDPPSVLFGDRIDADARIVVDDRVVDPGSIVLDPSFRPFQAFTSRRRVTTGIGHAAEVRFTFTLQCVTGACIRAMERESRGGSVRVVPIELPKATARGRALDGSVVTVPLTWPTLVVHSRLTADDIARGDPVAPSFVATAVDYHVRPDRLAWALVGLAVALIVGAGVLVAGVVAARRRERSLRLPAHLGAIDRALALARHALDTGDVDGGRKALERLSAELERGGRDDLAVEVGRIAWSPPGPSEAELDDLSRLVGSATNGG